MSLTSSLPATEGQPGATALPPAAFAWAAVDGDGCVVSFGATTDAASAPSMCFLDGHPLLSHGDAQQLMYLAMRVSKPGALHQPKHSSEGGPTGSLGKKLGGSSEPAISRKPSAVHLAGSHGKPEGGGGGMSASRRSTAGATSPPSIPAALTEVIVETDGRTLHFIPSYGDEYIRPHGGAVPLRGTLAPLSTSPTAGGPPGGPLDTAASQPTAMMIGGSSPQAALGASQPHPTDTMALPTAIGATGMSQGSQWYASGVWSATVSDGSTREFSGGVVVSSAAS